MPSTQGVPGWRSAKLPAGARGLRIASRYVPRIPAAPEGRLAAKLPPSPGIHARAAAKPLPESCSLTPYYLVKRTRKIVEEIFADILTTSVVVCDSSVNHGCG